MGGKWGRSSVLEEGLGRRDSSRYVFPKWVLLGGTGKRGPTEPVDLETGSSLSVPL